MGFRTDTLPDIEPAEFVSLPFRDRIRVLVTHWVDYGGGTAKMVHTIYCAKLILYITGGIAIATLTSGLTTLDVGTWWNEPIVYQKFVLWTVLLECMGLAGAWGPLCGHISPMTGGIRYWIRPGTIRQPPWPDKVPFTRGDTRTVVDVLIYGTILVNCIVVLALPGIETDSISRALPTDSGLVDPALLLPLIPLFVVIGLRDKVIFIAARGEQYLPAIVFFAILPFVDMIIALKLLIVVVWIGAGISKLGSHFSMVVPVMISNTPWVAWKRVKQAHYRSYPHDLLPSRMAGGVAHVLGTLVEVATPLVLLFSTNRTVTLIAVVLMVAFHLFILSTFPLAVPLEWNLVFAYATVFLFLGFPAWNGYGIGDMSSAWLTAAIAAALMFFPVLGNLRPDLVSFLPSMRQYAGNWSSATWAFAPGAEAKIDRSFNLPSKITKTQLMTVNPDADTAEMILHMSLGWRAMHSQGRALLSLMMRQLGRDIDTYSLREGEDGCNTMLGFNFGDGHLHNERLIEAIQRRCQFAPGEFIVAWIESQPIHKRVQEYKIIDAARGVIEKGTYRVSDAVTEQPWLPNGPIPFDVHWTADAGHHVSPGHGTAR
ncbi:DUF3556 domain-containing protein [Rhodococcus sp. LB1]|uniref:DUF3556 domain-containing protein n=1 Tax=Rhodococcus sp. LB1 TaxID=1807499 RepID=UPI00077A1F30|nr:DUF3556 domain-containing protein [Rhodococcus sp. LB1]KXX58798.1 hypothetical protein AZG88_08050 [Rhodococcus sp. LB1]